jgi:hypothetical protein
VFQKLQAALQSLSCQYHEYFVNISFTTTPIQHPLSYKYHHVLAAAQQITMANRTRGTSSRSKGKERAAETSVQTTRTYDNGASQSTLRFSTGNYSSMINTHFKLIILLQQEPAANPPVLDV